ncbi:hypothetical protein RJ641_018742 [Dillenia turbinata]|uniref:Uncharacterized protein n=1 Tax=Dillenia turbinata TaxID=194707 RepID=A0AAN8UR17_9MAGN
MFVACVFSSWLISGHTSFVKQSQLDQRASRCASILKLTFEHPKIKETFWAGPHICVWYQSMVEATTIGAAASAATVEACKDGRTILGYIKEQLNIAKKMDSIYCNLESESLKNTKLGLERRRKLKKHFLELEASYQKEKKAGLTLGLGPRSKITRELEEGITCMDGIAWRISKELKTKKYLLLLDEVFDVTTMRRIVKCLRALYLKGCVYLMEFPSDIEELKNLEIIDIRRTGFHDFSIQIGDLVCLKCLRLSLSSFDMRNNVPNQIRNVNAICGVISRLSSLEGLIIEVDSCSGGVKLEKLLQKMLPQ